jgi:HEPN domain-containing protein
MTPQEDARVLLALVDRHLRALRLNLDPAYPDEEWGFTAQQAVEKLLKVMIVLRDERPPFTDMLNVLAELAGVNLDPLLLALQPYAVEARYEEGPFPLPASRLEIMAAIERLRDDAVRGIGRSEMGSLMDLLQERLEGLIVQARELEASIAANVAGILEV